MHIGDGRDEPQMRQQAAGIWSEPELRLVQRIRGFAIGDRFEELVERGGFSPHGPYP
jgi:hypothetical protein